MTATRDHQKTISRGSSTVRIHKSSNKCSDFIKDVKLVINNIFKQKFKKQLLYSYLNKFLQSKAACLSKYWKNLYVSEFM